MGVIMEMEEAKEKAKDVMDKVVVSSKDAFSKAGNAIQKFGDKSVLKIEIMQLKSKRKNAVSKLGVYAVVALLIFIPVVIAGGAWIDWLAAILAAIGMSEVFLMKKQILVSVDFVLAVSSPPFSLISA